MRMPAIVLEGLPEVVPEGELPGDARVQRPKRIRVAEFEHGPVPGAGLRLEEGVANP